MINIICAAQTQQVHDITNFTLSSLNLAQWCQVCIKFLLPELNKWDGCSVDRTVSLEETYYI